MELCIFTFLQLPHLFLFDTWREWLWPQSLFTAFLSLLFSFLLLFSFSVIFQHFTFTFSIVAPSLQCSLIRQHSLSLSYDIVLLLTSGLCGSQMYYSMMWRIIEIQRTIYFLTLSLFGPFHVIKQKPGCHMTVNLYGSTLHNKRSHSQIFLETLFWHLSTLPDSFHRSTACTLLYCLQYFSLFQLFHLVHLSIAARPSSPQAASVF